MKVKSSLVVFAAFVSLLGFEQVSYSKSKEAKKTMPPVLMYHEVRNLEVEAQQGPVRPLEETETPLTSFLQQMEHISQNYNTVTSQELYDYLVNDAPLPPNPLVLTFDDGYWGEYHYAYPVLKDHNLKASFYVHTNYVGTMAGNPDRPTSFDHLSWDDLRTMAKNPNMEVFSHTLNHANLPTLSDEVLHKELRESRLAVESELKLAAPFFAYPYGFHDARVIEATKNYYAMAYIVGRATENISELYQIPRLFVGRESQGVDVFKCRLGKWQQGENPDVCNK